MAKASSSIATYDHSDPPGLLHGCISSHAVSRSVGLSGRWTKTVFAAFDHLPSAIANAGDRALKIEDYPPQEPISDFAMPYHEEVLRRGAGVAFDEFRYGDDPYQSVLVTAADAPSGEVLAFIHGGGWTNGYKEWMAFMAPALVEQGITFASIGYRLAPQTLFPDGYHDVIDGFTALHARVEDFGGDPEKMFVGGHSAGGHYSARMAVADDWQVPRGMTPNVVRGCLPVSGVFDFRPGNGMSGRPRFLGPEDAGTEERASPIANINRTPPFIVTWGSEDFPHLRDQGAAMAAALEAAGGAVETIILPGCDHFGASYAAGDPESGWPSRAAAWMKGQSA